LLKGQEKHEYFDLFMCFLTHSILYIKANMVSVRLSVAIKTTWGPKMSEVLKTFEDLNRGSQKENPSLGIWNEVLRKKIRRWASETKSLERKPVVRVLKRRCTPTGSSWFRTYWRRIDSRTQVRFSVGWCFWVFKEPPIQVL